jgi:serine/threonine-protein phosphatase 2A activator
MHKEIKKEQDVKTWEHSIAYAVLIDFLNRCNSLMKSKPNFYLLSAQDNDSNGIHATKAVEIIIDFLSEVMDSVRKVPLMEPESSRFGNPAFRSWMSHFVKGILPNWKCSMLAIYSESELYQEIMQQDLLTELSEYLEQSFGSSIRLDYGTGHELAFFAFLCCCEKIKCWSVDQSGSFVNILFLEYLKVVRELQIYFRLEPAGSRGVWGLDDYQFLPFLFGSSQLASSSDNLLSDPDIITRPSVIGKYRDKYLYLDAIAFINTMKSGPLPEHSPILYDISGLPNWEKINNGMIKMYKNEVLGKFPVIQHFLFGRLLPWTKFDLK